MKEASEPYEYELMFGKVLYASKGMGNGSAVAGLILAFFAIIIGMCLNTIYLSVEIKTAVTIICTVLTAIGIVLFINSVRKDDAAKKRICFAVFSDHLIIYPTNGEKDQGYVRISNDEIRGYVFRPHDSSGIDDILPNYQNYGKLKIVTKNFVYETEISNISLARAWMHHSLSMEETTDGRWDPPMLRTSSSALNDKGTKKENVYTPSEDALYAGGGVVKKYRLGLAGIILTFAPILPMIVFLTMYDPFSERNTKIIIVGGIIILTGLIVLTVSMMIDSRITKKVHFAVFRDHVMILPSGTDPKRAEYVRVPYKEITEYSFESGVTRSRSYQGELKMVTKRSEYRVDISNIELAREWMRKFVPVPETVQKR